MKDWNFKDTSKKLIRFIEESPSCFHVIENLTQEFEKNGFEKLEENQEWKIEEGKKYYVTRNQSSVIAFTVPKETCKGYHIIASHSDSPTYKIKVNPEIKVENQYLKLNTEGYGGMIKSSWLDRPLSFAGRVFVKEADSEEGYRQILVAPDRDLCIIPNLAIHMNREINGGYKYNDQVDMLPLFGSVKEDGAFESVLAEEAKVKKDEILGYDLFLVNRQKGVLLGYDEEYVGIGKLDDLQSVFASKEGFLQADTKDYISVLAVFDNEEVGSGTRQGADSTFLEDVLSDVAQLLGKDSREYHRMIANSFLISADNAHAVHPNHGEKADPTNRPYLNGGIVLKFHGGQKYTTDGLTAAMVKNISEKAEVPLQYFTNRSDMVGGSTLGNISTAHVSLNSADIGLPQLAMHSSYEVAGVKDTSYMIAFSKEFYEM